jgi:microtubule-associated protein 1
VKKFVAILVALMFAFAISTVTFAAEKPAEAPKAAPAPKAEEKKAEPAKAEPAKTEKKAKAKTKQVTGEVAAVDAAAKSITVKGKKGDVTLMADEKLLKDVKVGDKVTAKYTEADGKMTAKSIKKAAAKAEKKEAKPAEPKKAEPAPAPAPAPAAKPAEPAKK